MADPTRRGEIASAITKLINVNGATHVTLTLAAADAEELVKDLRWACKTTVRDYEVGEIKGEIRPCGISRNK